MRCGIITKVVLIAFALWGFSGPDLACARDGFTPAQEKAFQTALETGVAKCKVPGALAAVRLPQGAVWKGAAGLADIEKNKPMELGMHLHIGSLTKSFTAILFLQLVDAKKASLDDTVEKWLPGLLKTGNQITIRNLLQMRSGLARYEDNPVFDERFISQPRYKWKPEELVALCDKQVGPPGENFEYNNINYFLVGMIIEKALGVPFEEVINNQIFTPAVLRNTSFPLNSAMPGPFAHGYLNQDGKVMDVTTRWDTSAFWAAGSIISTLTDMLYYASVLFEGSLLSPAMHKEQFTFVPVGDDPKVGYGMGVGRKHDMVGHSGNYNGLYTSSLFELNGYYVVVLSNGQAADGDDQSGAPCVLAGLTEVIGKLPR